MLFPTIAYSADWFCKEGGSSWNENMLTVCGIGEAKTEEDAKIAALRNAAQEFKELCLQSADCRNHDSRIDPKRTDCERINGTYKCYRAFRYEIIDKISPTAFDEYQKKLLDEEIDLSEKKLQEMRAIKEREQKLADLNKKINSGNVSEDKTIDSSDQTPFRGISSGFDIGFDFLSISSAAFSGEGVFFSAGLSLQYRVEGYGDVEIGGNLDIAFPTSSSSTGSPFSFATPSSIVTTGSDYYLMIPMYLRVYNSSDNADNSAFFVAPEVRTYQYQGLSRTGVGASFGWKTVGKRSKGVADAVSFRIGASNLIDPSGLPPVFSVFLTWPIIPL